MTTSVDPSTPPTDRGSESLVACIDRTLDTALATDDERALEASARRLSALGRELAEELALEALALRAAASRQARAAVVTRIRALVRG